MAAELGWVGLGVSPDFTGFKGKLERGTVGPMAAAGNASGDSFGKSFSSRAKTAIKIGAAGIALAAAGAIKFAGDSLAEARDAQKVGAQTEAVIKSTGGAAKVSERNVGRLAERLSDMAGIDDELIQSGGNVLLTFTKIRNEAGKNNKVFDRATEAALNMSVALDTDLKSASVQVGKALNDPIKGVTALGRAGVQFTTVQRAQIKALVEGGTANAAVAMGLVADTKVFNDLLKAQDGDINKVVDSLTNQLTPAQKDAFNMYEEGGHTLEAQKRILKELDTQFAGSAKAQATEGDKLAVAWGNLKEDIGTELIPVMDDLAVLIREKGIPAAKDFAGWVKDDAVPAIKDFGDELKPVVGFVKDLGKFLGDLPNSVKIGGLASIAALIGGAKLRGGALGGGGGALGTAGRALGLAKPIPVFVTNPGGLGGVGDGPGGGKKGLAKKALPFATALGPAGAALFGSEMLLDYAEKNYPKRQRRDDEEFAKRLADSFHTAGVQAGALNDKANTLRDHLAVITNGATVPFKAPGLGDVLSRTKQYEGILDDLNGRQVRTYIETIQRNNTVEDIGGRGGKTPAGMVNDNRIFIEKVEAQDVSKFERQMRGKQRARSGGGR